EFSLDTPWKDLPEEVRDIIVNGRDHKVGVSYKNRFGREIRYSSGIEGVAAFVERVFNQVESGEWSRERWGAFLRETNCPDCDGKRLEPAVLAITVNKLSIFDFCELPLDAAFDFVANLKLSAKQEQIAAQVLREVKARIDFLKQV